MLGQSVLTEILNTDDKKLEAIDATENRCCMCKINRGLFPFILFNWIVIEIRYFNGLCLICRSHYTYTVKGKAIPLQAWTGPEGSRWLRLPDFKTIGT